MKRLTPDPRLPIGGLLQEFARLGFVLDGPVTHRTVQTAAADARIPAERINGRWYVRQADLPRIAAALGLIKAKPASRRRAITADVGATA